MTESADRARSLSKRRHPGRSRNTPKVNCSSPGRERGQCVALRTPRFSLTRCQFISSRSELDLHDCQSDLAIRFCRELLALTVRLHLFLSSASIIPSGVCTFQRTPSRNKPLAVDLNRKYVPSGVSLVPVREFTLRDGSYAIHEVGR